MDKNRQNLDKNGQSIENKISVIRFVLITGMKNERNFSFTWIYQLGLKVGILTPTRIQNEQCYENIVTRLRSRRNKCSKLWVLTIFLFSKINVKKYILEKKSFFSKSVNTKLHFFHFFTPIKRSVAATPNWWMILC